MKVSLPDDYWKYDKVKGAKRETLARLFGVYQSGMKAEPLTIVLKELNLTKARVDTRAEQLQAEIEESAQAIPGRTAEIRELNDYLDTTRHYDEAEDIHSKQDDGRNDGEDGDNGDDEDDDDDVSVDLM